MQFNYLKTDAGLFKKDYFSSKTQQKAIEHLMFAFDYAQSNNKFSFDINKTFNYDRREIAGFTGGVSTQFKGQWNNNPITVQIAFYSGFNPVSTSISKVGGDENITVLHFNDPRGNLPKISITTPVVKENSNGINIKLD